MSLITDYTLFSDLLIRAFIKCKIQGKFNICEASLPYVPIFFEVDHIANHNQNKMGQISFYEIINHHHHHHRRFCFDFSIGI